MRDLIIKAHELAKTAHEGQSYNDPGDYYEYHILGVVKEAMFMAEEDRYRVQIVATLHDAIEDSELTLDDLRDAGFPEDIVIDIAYLTKTKDTILDEYLTAIRDERPVALLVKKADMTFNLRNCIKEGNRKRFVKYSKQMEILLGK